MAIQYTPALALPYPDVTDAPLIASRDLRALAQKMDSAGAQIKGESEAALTASQAAEALAAQAVARANVIEDPIHVGPTEPADGEDLWVDTGDDSAGTGGGAVSSVDITDATDVGRAVLTAPLSANARNALSIFTGTRALLDEGTDTAERTWDAKELHEYVTDTATAAGGAASWDDLAGKPTSYPSTIPNVDGLQAALADASWYRGRSIPADANALTTRGVHSISSGDVAGIANRPSGTRTATTEIIVTPLENGVTHQEWRQYEATVWRRWERSLAGGSWRAWVEITPGGAPAPVDPSGPARSSTTSIACVGDSLTDGYSSGAAWDETDSYPARLGAWLGGGYTVTNLGFSGATTDQINVRLGAQPLHMRIPGGQIPASGTVTLASDQVIGGWGGSVSFDAYGYLAGIYGLLQYTSAGRYTFTRSGSGTAVTADTATFEGEFREHATDTLVYMAGRNDLSKAVQGMESTIVDHMMRGYADLVAYATPRRAQVVLCGTITRTDETPGSAGFEAVQELSTRLRLRWPERVIDVQGYLISAQVWADTGITPTQADLDAQARGMTPPSLFDDETHYSKVTAQALAEHLIGPWLKARGWV